LVFAVTDRIIKAWTLVRLQPAQVESLAGIDQIVAMAGGAARVVDGFSGGDFVLVRRNVIRQGAWRTPRRRDERDCGQ